MMLLQGARHRRWPRPNAEEFLLSQRNGVASAVTGGYGGAIYYVTNLDDSGAGSLRAGLESNDPLRIYPSPSLPDGTITLLTQINAKPNKTVDFYGSSKANVTITGRGIVLDLANAPAGATNANFIIQGLKFSGIVPNDSSDGLAYRGKWSGSPLIPADLTWTRYCTFTDVWDGLFDITNPVFQSSAGGPLIRHTIEWCEFGKNPGAAAVTAGGTLNWNTTPSNNNSPHNGKASLWGNSGTVDYATHAAALGISQFELITRHRFTQHHCYFHGTLQRNPRLVQCRYHGYNNYIKNFGWAFENGQPKGKGVDIANTADILLEGLVIGQYDVGEAHEVDGTAVTHPAIDAVVGNAIGNGAQRIKVVDAVVKSGLRVQESVSTMVHVPEYEYTVDPTVPGDFDHPTNVALRERIATNAGCGF